MNTFNYKDDTISVNLENESFGHYAEIDKAGVKRRYTLMQFYPDFNRKVIRVEYNIIFYDQDGNEISTPVKRSYQVPPVEFDQFYAMPVATTLGHAIAFNLVNGMLFDEFGVRCFHGDGSFYQPIVFDVEVNGTGVSVTIHNGAGGYEYSIDGGTTWQSEPTFSGLAPGTYTVHVRDSSGVANYKENIFISE